MPRKSKSSSNAESQSAASKNDPQPTLTENLGSTKKASPKDRDTGGKFTKGNAGGPGNPHARACARMLEVFRNAISEDEMLQICRMLFVKAVGGDVSAAKIILSYKMGKPLPAHHPDTIDRDEWDHYQQDAMDLKEMKTVLSGLPTRVGNDIARVSLPIMTAAWTTELATKLREGLNEESPKDQNVAGTSQAHDNGQVETESEELADNSEPLPNGKLNEKAGQQTAKRRPISNGKMNRKLERESTTQAMPGAKTNAADKKMDGKKMKKIRPAWLRPLAKQLQD